MIRRNGQKGWYHAPIRNALKMDSMCIPPCIHFYYRTPRRKRMMRRIFPTTKRATRRVARRASSNARWCAVGRLSSADAYGADVSPRTVILTPTCPIAEMRVHNRRNTAAEYSLDLRSGYTIADSTRNPSNRLIDSAKLLQSASAWTVVYPRHFVLAPGASQMVRIVARPPGPLEAGEYRARLTVHAQKRTPPPSGFTNTPERARLRVALETSIVLPVLYRNTPPIHPIATGP
jgi:hypothetical protein